jgi:hypothetical protein
MSSYLVQEPQEELLNAIASGQQAVVEVVKTWVDTVKSVTPKVPAPQLPLIDQLPTPEEVVTSAYDFAEKLLASQRQFAGELLKAMAPLQPGNDSGTQQPAADQ